MSTFSPPPPILWMWYLIFFWTKKKFWQTNREQTLPWNSNRTLWFCQNWYFCQIWYLCQIITFSIFDIFINCFWYFYQHLIYISIIDIFINCLLEYQLVVPVNCNFAVCPADQNKVFQVFSLRCEVPRVCRQDMQKIWMERATWLCDANFEGKTCNWSDSFFSTSWRILQLMWCLI